MLSIDRARVRKEFARIVRTGIGPEADGGDGTVESEGLFEYSTTDLQGVSPFVMIFSDGTNRPKREGYGDDSQFSTEVRLRVTYGVALPGEVDTNFSHADAEDLLDKLDKRIADLVIGSNESNEWMSLRYEPGFSQPQDFTLPGGGRYTIESHTVIAKVR
jgi:hypothetical protein